MGDVDTGTEGTITFVWENHHSILTQGLWALFTEKYQSDVKLECNGLSLWAHQLILSVFCPNLKTAFTNGSSRIKMDRLIRSGEDMELLVKVLYQGSVTVSQEHLDNLQKTAATLGIQDLLNAIELHKERQESEAPDNATYEDDQYEVQDALTRSTDVEIMVDLSNKCEVELTEVDDVERATIEQWCSSPVMDFDSDVANKHMVKSFWNNKPLLKCQYCSFKSYFMAGYKRHIMSHDKIPREKKLRCRHCEASFRDRLMYQSHLRTHMDIMPNGRFGIGRYRCHLCSYSSGRRSTFMNHLAVVHDLDSEGKPLPVGAFWCQDCGFTCEDETILTDHLEQNHPEKTSGYKSKFQCPSCSYVSAYKIVMERHKRIHEQPGKDFVCKICGLQMADKDRYAEHMNHHEDTAVNCDPPLPSPPPPPAQTSSKTPTDLCEICGYRNNMPSKLEQHRLKHTKAYPCPFCASCFTYKYNMGIHAENVHKKSRALAYAMMDTSAVQRGLIAKKAPTSEDGELGVVCVCFLKLNPPTQPLSECSNDDIITYSCSECSLTFEVRTEVQSHWETVHGDKFSMIYACGICDYRGKNFHRMSQHLRRHLTNGDSTDDEPNGDGSNEGKVESSTLQQQQQDRFVCFRCDLKFDSRKELKMHKRSRHYTSATLFKCSKCSYTSLQRSDVTRHLKESHARTGKAKK